jgi:hypothetical protein
LEIIVRNGVPARIFALETSFPTIFSKGTMGNLFYCTYFYRRLFFPATNSRKLWFPLVPLDITIGEEIPTDIIFAEPYLVQLFPWGTEGKHIFRELVAGKKGSVLKYMQ